MGFSIVVAIDENGGIGKNNTLPWHIPADLKHFARTTMGGTVIMGRKTWESIPQNYKPLKNRLNIVLTGNLNYEVPEGVKLASSIDGALGLVEGKAFVIGGAKLFEEAIIHAECDELIITKLFGSFDCDTFFPYIPDSFEKVSESPLEQDGGVKFKFVRYIKKNA
jgi:dihydrofolate reductase